MNEAMKKKLINAKDIAEVRSILPGLSASDCESLWAEMERHRSSASERLDLDELDSVSGGADRDWVEDGCAATCEPSSWCASNDFCVAFSVTYDNFWAKCPDGHEHEWDLLGYNCKRCGYFDPELVYK